MQFENPSNLVEFSCTIRRSIKVPAFVYPTFLVLNLLCTRPLVLNYSFNLIYFDWITQSGFHTPDDGRLHLLFSPCPSFQFETMMLHCVKRPHDPQAYSGCLVMIFLYLIFDALIILRLQDLFLILLKQGVNPFFVFLCTRILASPSLHQMKKTSWHNSSTPDHVLFMLDDCCRQVWPRRNQAVEHIYSVQKNSLQ